MLKGISQQLLKENTASLEEPEERKVHDHTRDNKYSQKLFVKYI